MVYKEGDRIEVIRSFYEEEVFIRRGRKGTIIAKYMWTDALGIRFDDNGCEFHNLGGKCEDKYGYWIDEDKVFLNCEVIPNKKNNLRGW